MNENLFIIILLVAAGTLLVVQFYRLAKGKSGCCCTFRPKNEPKREEATLNPPADNKQD